MDSLVKGPLDRGDYTPRRGDCLAGSDAEGNQPVLELAAGGRRMSGIITVDAEVLERVLYLTAEHVRTWRDRGNWYWFLGLLEEVVELALSLVGLHGDPPEHELRQVASICLNWLDLRAERALRQGGAQ